MVSTDTASPATPSGQNCSVMFSRAMAPTAGAVV